MATLRQFAMRMRYDTVSIYMNSVRSLTYLLDCPPVKTLLLRTLITPATCASSSERVLPLSGNA